MSRKTVKPVGSTGDFADLVTPQSVDASGNAVTDSNNNPATNVLVPDGLEVTGGQAGSSLYHPMLGTLTTYATLPGADFTYSVPLSLFGASNIYLAVLLTTATDATTVTVQYSNDGQIGNAHPEAADPLWTTQVGNENIIVPKKDAYAHIRIQQTTGTGTMHAYLNGREIA